MISESFERIHRSNLVGMGIMPLEYLPGQNAESLGLTGKESYTIEVPEDLKTGQTVDVKVGDAMPLFQTPEVKKSLSCSFKSSLVKRKTLGNLRTTTKFTTTTSVDWEKTGTRTSVSAGKRKLKMQSVGWSTTTTLNVNTNVKL